MRDLSRNKCHLVLSSGRVAIRQGAAEVADNGLTRCTMQSRVVRKSNVANLADQQKAKLDAAGIIQRAVKMWLSRRARDRAQHVVHLAVLHNRLAADHRAAQAAEAGALEAEKEAKRAVRAAKAADKRQAKRMQQARDVVPGQLHSGNMRRTQMLALMDGSDTAAPRVRASADKAKAVALARGVHTGRLRRMQEELNERRGLRQRQGPALVGDAAMPRSTRDKLTVLCTPVRTVRVTTTPASKKVFVVEHGGAWPAGVPRDGNAAAGLGTVVGTAIDFTELAHTSIRPRDLHGVHARASGCGGTATTPRRRPSTTPEAVLVSRLSHASAATAQRPPPAVQGDVMEVAAACPFRPGTSPGIRVRAAHLASGRRHVTTAQLHSVAVTEQACAAALWQAQASCSRSAEPSTPRLRPDLQAHVVESQEPQDADPAAHAASVLTQTQAGESLVGHSTGMRNLVGLYRSVWSDPRARCVDERDAQVRREMGYTGEGETLVPLHGRIVRTARDLSALVTTLAHTDSPSMGEALSTTHWSRPWSTHEAVPRVRQRAAPLGAPPPARRHLQGVMRTHAACEHYW